MYDLIIIGGGPAGITAGIYALRQKLKTLLISPELGGQLIEKVGNIENYPGFSEISGRELIEKFISHLKKFKPEIESDEVVKLEKKENFLVFTKSQKIFEAKSVILATGAKPRILNIPGEKEFLGKGVSYCPTCDGYFFKNKIVAVIGGGNTGLEAALFLSEISKKVYVLEFSDFLRGDFENQERVKKKKNIEIILNASLKEIKGEKFVKGLIYEDLKKKEKKELKIEGVFIQVGRVPATSFAKDLVDFNERGEIIVNFETLETKTPGLFAAGDCNFGKFKQIVIACGEGAKAALFASVYIRTSKKS